MENKHVNLLTNLYKQTIEAERELGLTNKPEASTAILKMRIRAGEKLTLQYSYHNTGWCPEPLAPLEAPYLRLAEPEKPAEWKAGDYLSGDAGLVIQFVARSGSSKISGIVVQPGLPYYTPGEIFDGFGASYFTSYTPTPEERIRFDRIVANAKLKAEWDKAPFPVQAWNHTAEPFAEWHDIAGDINWSAAHLTYRRRPDLRVVPWSAEDDLLGVKIRQKRFANYRVTIHGQDTHLVFFTTESKSYKFIFDKFVIHAPGEQLDGTPCGKEVAE